MLRTSLKHYADRNGLCVSELNYLEVANPDVCGYSKAVGCSCFFLSEEFKVCFKDRQAIWSVSVGVASMVRV